MTRLAGVVAILAGASGVVALAVLAGRAQVRDPGTAATTTLTGTGLIAGRVVTTDDAPQPMRRVVVTVTGTGLPGGRTMITDRDGRFVFDSLPAGRFELKGTRAAWLPSAYGAARPGGPGVPIQLAAGERLDDVVLVMARGAVVSGALSGPNGDPVPGLNVAVFELPRPGTDRTLILTNYAMTDDRGVYRVFGLKPGRYLVAAMAPPGGRIADVAAYSNAQIDAMLAALTARSAVAAASSAAVMPTRASFDTVAFAPVFYPGTPSPASATLVTLGVGEQHDDMDFTVQLTRMSSIEGTLVDNGLPVAPLIINPATWRLPSLLDNAPSYTQERTPTGLDFAYTNVVPGRYRITAQSNDKLAWARATVDVTGDDVAGVSLVLQPALALTGRVEFDGDRLAPPGAAAVSLRVAPPEGAGQGSVGYTRLGAAVIPPAVVRPDGTFSLGGLLPDEYRVTAAITGTPGWSARSVIVNGVDVLDVPLVVGETDLAGAVVTFTDRETRLSGMISTTAGAPAPAYFIAVFPADRSLWRPGARRIRTARAGTDGSWVVTGLPAGEYLLAAASDLADDDLVDPAFLDALAAASVPVALAEGEHRTQDLQIQARAPSDRSRPRF